MKNIILPVVSVMPTIAIAHTDYIPHVHVGFFSEIQEFATALATSHNGTTIGVVIAAVIAAIAVRKFWS